MKSDSKSAIPNPGTAEPSPSLKIDVMQVSLVSYVCGLVGLVPVFGLPFALAAAIMGRLARGKSPGWSNPADRYARAASWIGPAGFLVSGVFVLLLSGIGSGLDVGGGGGGG